MEIKKNPRVSLESYSKLFSQIGLVLALFIVYTLIESKTYEKEVKTLSQAIMHKQVEEETVIIEPKVITAPPKTVSVIPQVIQVVDNQEKIEEAVLQSTETDESEAVEYVEPEEIQEAAVEEEIVEDVPFMVIEKVPVYPGCEGNNQALKKCFAKSIEKFFQKKFDPGLAQELGLTAGKKRIIVQFKIDKKGIVTDIKARAPHIRLKKEAMAIIASLPKMEPGKQRGKFVGVRYTLPITFLIE